MSLRQERENERTAKMREDTGYDGIERRERANVSLGPGFEIPHDLRVERDRSGALSSMVIYDVSLARCLVQIKTAMAVAMWL